MSGRVKGRPIRLATAIADDMPCALMGDPRRIRQVITNLLSNALRFTDEGYIILRSRTDGEQWLVEVEDSGCGIDPAKLAEIFQPFVQVSGKRGGTGLGLTISSRLAQAMGGELSATSTPEEAVFVYACRYVLPRHPCQKQSIRRCVLTVYVCC